MKIKTFVDGRLPSEGKLPIEEIVNQFCETVNAVDIQVHVPSVKSEPTIAVVVYNEKGAFKK